MLTLDAMEYAPTLWIVLTAREHLTRVECRAHLRQLRKVARKGWPNVEWFVQVEFQRRGALHLNLLVKGVPVEHLEQFRALMVERWCTRVDAKPVGQWAGVVADGVGVVLYVSKMLAHGLKAEQAPPIGWRGHRTSQTRGYLVRPASVMRKEARESLSVKRRLWKAMRLAATAVGEEQIVPASLVEQAYEHLEARDRETAGPWMLRQMGPRERDDDEVAARQKAQLIWDAHGPIRRLKAIGHPGASARSAKE